MGKSWRSGTITVEVDHFSIYGVLADASATAAGQDEVATSKIPSNQEITKGGNVLPNTATNVYNLIAVGVLLVIISVFVIARKKRQA